MMGTMRSEGRAGAFWSMDVEVEMGSGDILENPGLGVLQVHISFYTMTRIGMTTTHSGLFGLGDMVDTFGYIGGREERQEVQREIDFTV